MERCCPGRSSACSTSALLRLADPEARCVVQRFCGHCWKQDQSRAACSGSSLHAPALALVAPDPLVGAHPPRRSDHAGLRHRRALVQGRGGADRRVPRLPGHRGAAPAGDDRAAPARKKALQHAQAPFSAAGILSTPAPLGCSSPVASGMPLGRTERSRSGAASRRGNPRPPKKGACACCSAFLPRRSCTVVASRQRRDGR